MSLSPIAILSSSVYLFFYQAFIQYTVFAGFEDLRLVMILRPEVPERCQ